MSDHFTRFIPVDPRFVPGQKAEAAALAVLRAAAPEAEDISSETDEHVLFRDCGENFEAIRCPGCGLEIAAETWQAWMTADYADDGGFRLEPLTTPCCGIRETLDSLGYEPPQGFSRYALSGMNLGRELPAGMVGDLETRGRPEAVLLREALEQYLARQERPRPRAVGRSRDGGVARRVDQALEDLGFGTR